MRISISLVAVLLAASPAARASDPDFSGSWQIDHEKSQLASLPGKPVESIQVTHTGTSIRFIETRDAGLSPLEWSFTTDGKESKAKGAEETRSIIAKWEGSALLVNTIVNTASGSRTLMDRWKLSRDGKRLLIHRQIEQTRGEIEADLVYQRK
jgi:hypothetical protein